MHLKTQVCLKASRVLQVIRMFRIARKSSASVESGGTFTFELMFELKQFLLVLVL